MQKVNGFLDYNDHSDFNGSTPDFFPRSNPVEMSSRRIPTQPKGRIDSFISFALRMAGIPRPLAKFVLLCILWYASSAATNNISKQIMNSFQYPVTLTLVQFGFVAAFCVLFGQGLGFTNVQPLCLTVVRQTLPLSIFQIAGHVFSSVALTRVTVSFSHTIKALSPALTVFIYRIFYSIPYSARVYVSLIPLTTGVMLVCASKMQFDTIGFFCSLSATIIFVLQNIFSKKIFVANSPHASLPTAASKSPKHSHPHIKLDKLNLLFYTGVFAFVIMSPAWLYYEGWELLFSSSSPNSIPDDQRPPGPPLTHLHLFMLLILNGTTHFFQNFFAFSVLALPTVSPVTYSIASLVKRIVVISASIVYFNDTVSVLQGFGLFMTFFGLWTYQIAKTEVDKGEKKWEAWVEKEAEEEELRDDIRAHSRN